MNPLNEPELLRLGVSPDNIKRARFAYILLTNTVKDGVGRCVEFRSRSPSVAVCIHFAYQYGEGRCWKVR